MTENRQLVYRTLPFIVLLLMILLINVVPRLRLSPVTPTAADPTRPGITGTPPPAPSTASATNTNTPTTQPPTVTPAPTASPTPYPAGAEIKLLGPPANSQFQPEGTIQFYWSWPYPLAETRQFSLYWQQGNNEQRLRSLTEPNLGTHYRLSVIVDETFPAGEGSWQIRLETAATQANILSSQSRSLAIISD